MVPELRRDPLRDLMLPDELTGGILDDEVAVDGRLIPDLGGWGKAAMLMVLRSDLSGLLGARPLEIDRWVVTLVVELDKGDLVRDGLGLEGARSLVGWAGDADREESLETGRLFLVLRTGRGGTDVAGLFAAGREG